MEVYWSMLGVTALLGIVSYYFPKHNNKLGDDNQQTTRFLFAFLIFGYIIFLAGVRSGVADTPFYIDSYNGLTTSLSEVWKYWDFEMKGWGFWFLSAVFKCLVSADYHWWLFVISAVSGFCVMRTMYKHSVDFPLSAFLFIGTATYTWMFNGMRQFVAAAILFAFADWLFKGKTLRYILLIILVASIHSSAFIMIPICLIVRFRPPWNRKINFFIILMIVAVFFADSFTDFFAEATGYGDYLTDSGGSSFLRVIISAVPCVIAFWKRKQIKEIDSPMIDICINMSVVTTCFYLFSTFSSGTYIGRIPIYFSMYALILLPWLISKVFQRRERALVYFLCVICYLYYFVSTIYTVYYSDILNIYYLG